MAGIRLPHERIPALAAGLEITRRVAELLSRVDYGDAEPASRFRAPEPDDR